MIQLYVLDKSTFQVKIHIQVESKGMGKDISKESWSAIVMSEKIHSIFKNVTSGKKTFYNNKFQSNRKV